MLVSDIDSSQVISKKSNQKMFTAHLHPSGSLINTEIWQINKMTITLKW